MKKFCVPGLDLAKGASILGFARRILHAAAVVATVTAAAPAQTPEWTPTGQLAVPRAGHSVTRLADGQFLVAGGENSGGLVGQAEIFNPATASTVPTATPMVNPRKGHTATLLADGRVLFAGGEGAGGVLASAEIFDPATSSFAPAGLMVHARVHHTATVLTPEWILLAGGNGGAGALNTMEIYNVARNQFQPLEVLLLTAREQHTASLQPDGTVFLAGGLSYTGPLTNTEILRTEDWSVAPGPPLQQARYAHSATVTLFGDVILAGGTDGLSSLASVETAFHANEEGVLDFSADALHVARSGHQAVALPQNGNILLVGGSSEAGLVAEVEVMGLHNHETAPAGVLAVPRSRAGVVSGQGRACVLGGEGSGGVFLSSVECYGYTTITTDQPDYPPNSIVTFSGGGWVPGETVEIRLQALGRDSATTLFAVADAQGGILNSDFMTTDADLGALFYVTATGATSGGMAFMTFTDKHATVDPCGALVRLCSVTPHLLDPFQTVTLELDIRGVGTFNTFDVTVVNQDDPNRSRTFKNVSKDGSILSFSFPTPTVVSEVGAPMDIFFTARLVVSVPSSIHCHKKVLGVCVSPHIHTTKVTTLSANSNSQEILVNPPAPGGTGDSTDATPPSIVPTVVGTLGDNGWYISDVTVSWSVADPESTFTPSGCEASTVASDTSGVTLTCTATSEGGTSTESVTLKRDATAPAIVFGAPIPAANPAGWNNTDVSISFTLSDNLSGLADPVPSSPLTLPDEGMAVGGEISVSDLAGNVATALSPVVNIDKTAPEIAGSRAPEPNPKGWNNTDVTVSFACTDELSGLAAGSPPADTTLSGEGAAQSFTGTCSDAAGNHAAATVTGINIDKTAPTISGAPDRAPDSNDWYNHAVDVTWTCTDELSGLLSCSPLSTYNGPDSPSASVTGTATDLAGNSASDTVGFQYDATPPVISLITPADNAVFLLDEAVPSAYSCSDNLSGVGTCLGTATPGANVPTSLVGSQQFTVNGTDVAGNTAVKTHAYEVHFVFEGFFQPVDNLPFVNASKAGRTLPVKWTLKNANGETVGDLASFGSLFSSPVACDASPTTVVEEEVVATGGTVLRFESGQFIYNWQTSSDWNGCRMLQLSLSDGTRHYAKFDFR